MKQDGAQRRGYRYLLLLEKRKVGFVASVFHLFEWDEMKGSRINDVTPFSGRLRVAEDMPEASVTSLVAHLDPLHLVCVVGYLDKAIVSNSFRKLRQSDFSVKLDDQTEQRLANIEIKIDPDLPVHPEPILKRCLRAVSPHDVPFLGL